MRQYRWSRRLYISLRRWNSFFRFPRRPWLFLLVYLVVLWKCEGIKWSFSATGTSRLVRRKLQVCGNSREGSVNAFWADLIFWNAASLVKLDVRTAMAVAFMVGTIHRDKSQKTMLHFFVSEQKSPSLLSLIGNGECCLLSPSFYCQIRCNCQVTRSE